MGKGISNYGSYAFDDSELLKSVTTIESWAFGGDYREQYTELETVIIGENVTNIKKYTTKSFGG